MKLGALPVALLLLSARVPAEDWSRFRGPNGSGVSRDTGFPAEFGRDKNLVWRTPVRPGKSSPVLTSTRVFLTAFENGKLFTQCFDRQTGKLLWEHAEPRPREEDVNKLNNPAAITPVTDGENVYAFFKDFGLISYSPEGKVRWQVPLGPFSSSMGLGASPIFAGGSVIVLADQREDSYIAAFDRRNGEIRWKTAREELESWGTPLVYEAPGAQPEVVTASRGQFGAHLVADGKKAFRLPGIATTIVASPVLDGDTVYLFGYGNDATQPFSQPLNKFDKNHDGKISPDEYGDNAVMLAIGRYIGNRDLVVTEAKWDAWQRAVIGPSRLSAIRLDREGGRELWHVDRNFTGVVPSPLLYQGVLYVVKNGGILTSFDPATGKELKAARVTGAPGGYSASPVAADGKIYLASEEGKVAVVRPGAEWDVLAVTDLGEGCYATPALSGGQIYVRTADALYCFGAAHRSAAAR